MKTISLSSFSPHRLLIGLAFTAAFSFCAQALSQEVDLKVGDKAPAFSAEDDTGKTWSSADATGKHIVVYFYPAAMTGGCTKQACGFRDASDELEKAGAVVVGISGDEAKNLALFKTAHELNFPLLADHDGSVAKAFGVPSKAGEKSLERELDGATHTLTRHTTTQRWTFIISKDGKIVHKSNKVNAAKDSVDVLKVLQSL